MKKIKTIREFQIRLSELDGKYSHSVSSRHEVIEEKDYRKLFLEAIASNCSPETFEKVKEDILMDDILFQTYVLFKSSDHSEEEESQWMKNAINGILQITSIINKSEIIMTATQTTTPSSTETKDNTMNKPQEQTAVPAAPATPSQATPVAPAPSSPVSTGFDWAAAGKTVGIFVGGAAVGAAGKWAWDHFFG